LVKPSNTALEQSKDAGKERKKKKGRVEKESLRSRGKGKRSLEREIKKSKKTSHHLLKEGGTKKKKALTLYDVGQKEGGPQQSRNQEKGVRYKKRERRRGGARKR